MQGQACSYKGASTTWHPTWDVGRAWKGLPGRKVVSIPRVLEGQSQRAGSWYRAEVGAVLRCGEQGCASTPESSIQTQPRRALNEIH